MSNLDRIVIDPDILVGKPVVKGTRLSVELLLGLLAQGWSESEILRNYPGLQREDLLACWAYAAEALGREKVYRFQVA
ncbi:antitoxin [Planctomycetaceae bacterium SCGC AG-212-F19]|nr:antitoxin [Planctomycetaceae bacterium SCGC AG-212-F19]